MYYNIQIQMEFLNRIMHMLVLTTINYCALANNWAEQVKGKTEKGCNSLEKTILKPGVQFFCQH